jgi:hypothetical protein
MLAQVIEAVWSPGVLPFAWRTPVHAEPRVEASPGRATKRAHGQSLRAPRQRSRLRSPSPVQHEYIDIEMGTDTDATIDAATVTADTTPRANAPSEHKALWRNLLFHMMSAVRTFSERAPEAERMTFMGAWSLLCEKVAAGRSMVWSTLNWQWRYCRAMVCIYGKLRAHHRIHQPGQEDYYARLERERLDYWADVQLPNGTWATREDRSIRAKRARHRRYKNKGGNAVYRDKYNSGIDDEGMDDTSDAEEEDMRRRGW